MFPLRDHNPTEIFPFFTVLIMVLTAGTWLLVQGLGLSDNALYESICTLGVVPADITGLNVVKGANVCESSNIGMASVLSSMFLHVSWGHLLGNLWFLWVFGNNIEDSMGHLSFVAFYLITGMAAVMAGPPYTGGGTSSTSADGSDGSKGSAPRGGTGGRPSLVALAISTKRNFAYFTFSAKSAGMSPNCRRISAW